ncbi:endo-beta-1 4-glucanase D [Fusarium beomiforme]|uniref:lytic cellulose monooxygenase (C4-dehydrogenating) n=1 Tax=Fusarium beomiforme TaxID=44412 RepID=A0A9P5AEX0_9HYPO|nr:endo-beta-1 4-glucanase D [Fusarium beomiforme]
MRSSFSTALAIVAALPSAFAHYNFDALIVNGEVTKPYEYVRKTTNNNSPITDVTSKDIICNAGGLDKDIRAATKTHKVSPGDEVGFTVASEIGHPGPLSVYLSKAPDGTAASDYLGDGDWFKVYEMTWKTIGADGITWANYLNGQSGGINNFTFTLPKDTPKGTYLMRAEHVGLHGAGEKNGAQFYIGCAQITVDGNGAGKPSPVVSLPGAYKATDPGLLLSIYYPPVTNYTAPGPKVWPSGCEDHTPNFAGQASDGDCTNDKAGSGSGSGSAAPVASDAPATEAPIATEAPASTEAAGAATPTEAPVEQPATTSAPVATKAPSTGGKCKAKRAAKRAAKAKRALKL